MPSSRVFLVCFVAGLALSCDHSPHTAARAGSAVREAGPCDPGVAQSRWSPDDRDRYAATASFGLEDDFKSSRAWLAGITGIGRTGDGRLYVYDGPNSRIVRLTPALRFDGEFGVEGEGPGELRALPDLSTRSPDWLTVDDELVQVFDGVAVNVFSPDGEFRRRFGAAALDGIIAFEIKAIHRHAGETFLAYDTRIPLGGEDERGLQTWRVEGGDRTLVTRLPLASLPRSGNVVVSGRAQAKPAWDAADGCYVATDGAAPWAVTGPLAVSEGDYRVRLPETDVKAPARTAGGEADAEMRDVLAAFGASQSTHAFEPTAPRRWGGIALDPDGFIWVTPWDPAREPGDPVTVFVVDPRSGDYREHELPRFPHVFGEPGVFYGVSAHPEAEVPLVVRYERMSG